MLGFSPSPASVLPRPFVRRDFLTYFLRQSLPFLCLAGCCFSYLSVQPSLFTAAAVFVSLPLFSHLFCSLYPPLHSSPPPQWNHLSSISHFSQLQFSHCSPIILCFLHSVPLLPQWPAPPSSTSRLVITPLFTPPCSSPAASVRSPHVCSHFSPPPSSSSISTD